MLQFIKEFSRTRFCWLLLLLLGIVLEGAGLYFQYGRHLEPCVNCVYERAWFLGFIAAGLIGIFFAPYWLFRLVSILILLGTSIGGLLTGIEHLESYDPDANLFTGGCQLTASFPAFFKLDDWLPWMFRAQGACGPLDWNLLTLNMPQWVVITFGCGIAAGALMLISFFLKKQRRSYYERYYR